MHRQVDKGLEYGALFGNRLKAGAVLAARLDEYRGKDALVLGIARGGMVVAAVVARRLNAEMDVVVARKLGAPNQPELAIGALTASGIRILYCASTPPSRWGPAERPGPSRGSDPLSRRTLPAGLTEDWFS